MFNGTETNSGRVTQYVSYGIRVHNYLEKIRLYVTQLAYYPVVLGLLWLK